MILSQCASLTFIKLLQYMLLLNKILYLSPDIMLRSDIYSNDLNNVYCIQDDITRRGSKINYGEHTGE